VPSRNASLWRQPDRFELELVFDFAAVGVPGAKPVAPQEHARGAVCVPLPRFDWSDLAPVRHVAADLGATVRFHGGGQIVFAAASPEQYLETQEHDHPLMIGANSVLQRAGTLDAVRDQLLRVVCDRNEEPGAFRMTSRYCVIEIRGGGADVPAGAGTR
jgi:hypothetical protein